MLDSLFFASKKRQNSAVSPADFGDPLAGYVFQPVPGDQVLDVFKVMSGRKRRISVFNRPDFSFCYKMKHFHLLAMAQ